MKYILIFVFASLFNPFGGYGSNQERLCYNDVAVLIHGCHLKAEEWETIVFGSGKKLGRVQTAIEEAVGKNAKLIIWGSGASQIENGLKESEYIFSQSLGPKFTEITKFLCKSPQELFHYLKQVSIIDTQSQNTTEEIKNAIQLCSSKGITELILVSSPTHIARCLQEAYKIKANDEKTSLKIYGLASDTCFAHSTPSDVLIVEPPHRGDKPTIDYTGPIKEIIQFLKIPDVAKAFHGDLIQLIEKYKTNKVPV